MLHTKHQKANAIPRTSKKRNSSIELLRIIAMLMIISAHSVGQSELFKENLPALNPKLLFFVCMGSLGKIGAMIFFTISAWYLCMERNPTLRKNLKRIWILEREVILYSVLLLVFSLIYFRNYISLSTAVYSFFPSTSGRIWWYVTAYIIFLILCPALTKGLRAIGKRSHASLCVAMLICWGIIAGMLPMKFLESDKSNYAEFLFIYVIVSFYRWYIDDWGSKIAWVMITLGSTLIIGSILALQLIGSALDNNFIRSHSGFLTMSCTKLPVLLFGFGIIILFQKKHFNNKLINTIASATFGIYLIHTYPAIDKVLWTNIINMKQLYSSSFAVILLIAIVVSVFSICMCIDFVRQFLFKYTLDIHRGIAFDKLYTLISKQSWMIKTNKIIMSKPIPHESLISGKDLIDQADEPIPRTAE